MTVFIKEISDYLQQLCEQHAEVADSTTNRAFCRYHDTEELAQLRNAASKNIVVVKSFFGRASGDYEDAGMKNTIVICFSSYAITVKSADIVAASEKAFTIMADFLVKMRQDFEYDDCAWLKGVDWNNVQFDEIEQPWLQNHYGWDLVLPYRTVLPAYDANRWVPGSEPTDLQQLRLTPIMRFRVGAPGAPMTEDDEFLENVLFFNQKLLVLVDGIALSCDDGSGDIEWIDSIARRYEKTLPGKKIRFIGGVVDKEIIEIYEVH